VLEATLLRAAAPRAAWRELMERLAGPLRFTLGGGGALTNAGFVEYFRQATPEQELARLATRQPAKPSGASQGGIETCGAIPWIFALDGKTRSDACRPGWARAAGACMSHAGRGAVISLRRHDASVGRSFWRRIEIVEMVLAKRCGIAQFYEQAPGQIPAALSHWACGLRESAASSDGCYTAFRQT